MDLFNIIIDNKKYNYIDSISLKNKNYVAFTDDENIYVSEYFLIAGDIVFKNVDDATYDMVIKELNL